MPMLVHETNLGQHASKSGKATQTYTDGDHFAIAQSTTILAGALELMTINL